MGWDAEEWYEDFENSSPEVISSWSTLRKHFRIKWLGANPNVLLGITETKPATIGAATTTSRQTTTTTTATDSNNATTTIEQQDNEEPTAGGEKELEMGVEKQEGMCERKVDAGEREEMTMTQSEPARFDWAAEVDEAFGLTPIERNTGWRTSVNLAPISPSNLVPNNAATSIANETAPNASGPRSPTPLAHPDTNQQPNGLNDPPARSEGPKAISHAPTTSHDAPVPTKLDCTPAKPTTVSSDGSTMSSQPAHVLPKHAITPIGDTILKIAPTNCTPTSSGNAATDPVHVISTNAILSGHLKPIPIHLMFASAVLVDPDPGDAAACTQFTFSYPTNLTLASKTFSIKSHKVRKSLWIANTDVRI